MALAKSPVEIVQESSNKVLGKHPSWMRVELGHIANILNGYAFKSVLFSSDPGKGKPLIRIRDIGKNKTNTYYSGEFDEQYIVKKGDLLIGMDGDFNAAIWQGEDGLLNQRVCKVDLKTCLYNKKFLSYVIQPYLDAINAETSSVTVKHLSSGSIGKIPLPLPPFNVQQAIVEKIEELFSHIDAGVEGLKQTKAKLQQYPQSVLKDAVTGKLTEKWRVKNADKLEPADALLERILTERRANWEQEQQKAFISTGRKPKNESWKNKYKQPLSPEVMADNIFPNSWEIVSPDMVFNSVTDGDHQAPPRAESGMPFLVIGDVKSGAIVVSNKRFVPKSYYDEIKPERKPSKGDLLYTVVGSYGIPVRVDTDLAFCVQRHIAILKPTTGIISDFYFHVFNSGFLRKQADSVATGTAQKTVPLRGLRRLKVPLPPFLEQIEIVRRVNDKIEKANRAVNAIEAKIKYSSTLKTSLLEKALSGQLVSNESEQTALELLERIKAKKQQQVKETKGKTKKEKKVITERKSLESVLKTLKEPVSSEELMRAAGFSLDEVEEFYIELAALSTKIEKFMPAPDKLKSWPYEKGAGMKLKLRD